MTEEDGGDSEGAPPAGGPAQSPDSSAGEANAALRGLSRRRLFVHGSTAAGALALGSGGTLKTTRWAEEAQIPTQAAPRALLNDASGLNATSVRGVVFAESSARSTGGFLAPLLRRIAEGADPRLAISGARHSMGGQSLMPGGWVLDTLPMNGMSVDPATRIMRVGAGATWRDVIPFLNAAGYSPLIMQSNNDFTVGGSLSVNCHGWQANRPPIADTVQSLRLLTAEGALLTCSRQENSELFRLVLGGYGLFGVVLDADVVVAPNVRYKPKFATIATYDYAARFRELVYKSGSPVQMAYGRLSVDPGGFLEQAIIGTFVPDQDSQGVVLPLTQPRLIGLGRAIFRNSEDSDSGKALRWWLERNVGTLLAHPISRNSLLNVPARVFASSSKETTDILHEYFVPQHRLWEFVKSVRRIIRRADANLLNVTVRDVRRDQNSVLRYAHQDVFGLVMLFTQDRSDAGEERMRKLTQSLIDAVIAEGGSFYLPYRLHATRSQLQRAYPAWEKVISAKHRYDPHGVFDNGLYRQYGHRRRPR